MGNYYFRRDPVEEPILPIVVEEIETEEVKNDEEATVVDVVLPENYY